MLLPEGVKKSSQSVPVRFPEVLGRPRKSQQNRRIRTRPSEQIIHSRPQIPARRVFRRGPLPSESKEHAGAMRRHGACIRCRLLKVAVSI